MGGMRGLGRLGGMGDAISGMKSLLIGKFAN